MTHPARGDRPINFADFENSMRMTAMIGTGLIATMQSCVLPMELGIVCNS